MSKERRGLHPQVYAQGALIASGRGTDLYLTDEDEVLWIDEDGKWEDVPQR